MLLGLSPPVSRGGSPIVPRSLEALRLPMITVGRPGLLTHYCDAFSVQRLVEPCCQ